MVVKKVGVASAAKMLGALGDGGAVVTDDEEVAQTLRELRDHGRDAGTGEVVRWGRNSRLDNVQAAVLLIKLARIDEAVTTRRRLGARYHQGLKDIAHERAQSFTVVAAARLDETNVNRHEKIGL